MAKNVGGADRVIRLVLGIILLALGIWYFGGLWQWVSGIVGVVLLLTSIVSFCPLYGPIRVNTAKSKVEEAQTQ
jgi:hypothetical protein